MPIMKGKKALLEILASEGVEYVFGNPGSTELLFLDALQDYPGIKYILGLHESVALGMASGYSRASGKAGVVNLHTAPGLANALSLLLNSYEGGENLVVTAGQQDTRLLMQEPWITADLVRMAGQFTKWSAEIARAADIPLVMRRAFKVAAQPPTGPAFVSIPQDLLDEDLEVELRPPSPPYPRSRPDPQAVSRAVELLSRATAPGIVVGEGVARSQAMAEMVRMAELMGAPVYQAWMSDVNFPTNHPLYLGDLNVESPETRELLRAFDVLLTVGCSLFKQAFYLPVPLLTQNTSVIQVDDNPWEIGKNYPVAVGLLADPQRALAELIAELENKMSPATREIAATRAKGIEAEKRKRQEAFERRARRDWDSVPITVGRLVLELGSSILPGTVVVDDAATCSYLVRRNLIFTKPGTYFRIRGGGSLGWGLPAALGVKLALPDRPVVAIVGDGSAMYSIQSLWTAAHHDIPVTYVICNNASYRILKLNMLRTLGEEGRQRFIAMDLTEPPLNFGEIARSLGVHGQRVERPEELGPALREALHLGKPALVDVAIEGSVG